MKLFAAVMAKKVTLDLMATYSLEKFVAVVEL